LGGETARSHLFRHPHLSTEAGSNYANMLFLVSFDEHGGTYDHVPPPSAPPPDPAAPPGQMGFRFDRSDVRIPILAISATSTRRPS
jgi:phospholipase C